MDGNLDIDETLRDWPFEPGAISARLVEAADGRHVVQMRVEMGLIQMEVDHRPDGKRPGDALLPASEGSGLRQFHPDEPSLTRPSRRHSASRA